MRMKDFSLVGMRMKDFSFISWNENERLLIRLVGMRMKEFSLDLLE
jgi:hypothetical protein